MPGNHAESGGVLRQPNTILPTSRWPLLTQDDVPDVEEEEEPGVDASGADNSDAALALLRALARADPEVRSRVRTCLTSKILMLPLAWQGSDDRQVVLRAPVCAAKQVDDLSVPTGTRL